MPSGVRSPACSASCQPFFRATLPSSPRRYASARRRGSARANRPAIRACRAPNPAAHPWTSSMSAASSASSTAPPALHVLWTTGPSPASGQEPYRTNPSAAGVLGSVPPQLVGVASAACQLASEVVVQLEHYSSYLG